MKQPVTGAAYQVAHEARRVRRPGEHRHLGAREQHLDVVRSLRGGDLHARDRGDGLPAAQVQEREEDLQTHQPSDLVGRGKPLHRSSQKPLGPGVVVEQQERHPGVIVSDRRVGLERERAPGMHQRLVVAAGGDLAEARVVEHFGVAGSDGDGAAVFDQRFLQAPHLLQVQRERLMCRAELRIDLERRVGSIEPTRQRRQIAVGAK